VPYGYWLDDRHLASYSLTPFSQIYFVFLFYLQFIFFMYSGPAYFLTKTIMGPSDEEVADTTAAIDDVANNASEEAPVDDSEDDSE